MSVPARLRLAVAGVLLVGLVGASPALAEVGTPWWHLTSQVLPATLRPGGAGTIVVQALNLGDGPTAGAITLTDTLPQGVSVQKVEPEAGKPEPEVSLIASAASPGWGASEERRYHEGGFGPEEGQGYLHTCSEPAPREIRCTYNAEGFLAALNPYEFLELGIAVKAEGGAGSTAASESEVAVTGGEAPAVNVTHPVPVSEAPPTFGVEQDGYSFVPEEAGGVPDARAGSHPFQLTQSLALNQNADPLAPPALPRDLRFRLPVGLVGNARALPQCSEADFTKLQGGIADLCPDDTAIGVATITIDEPVFGGVQTISLPLFNLVPGHGEPARFGFEYVGTPVSIDTSLRTGEDYGVIASVSNITELANFLSSTVTFWGVPGESSHDESRGWGCLAGQHWSGQAGLSCVLDRESEPRPFLTLPTSCEAPFTTSVQGESWPLKGAAGGEPAPLQLPGLPRETYSLIDRYGRPLGLTGCNQLAFGPFIEAAPDVRDASSPSGLTVHVRVPQEVSEDAQGLASSSVKDITVALPAGVQVNPSGGNGLEACAEGQVGFEADRGENGFEEFNPETEPGVRTPLFSPTVPEPLSPGLNLGALGFCPNASKVGTVKIVSPLIASPLEGSVYLASQNANPFGSLLAMYIVAEDPVSGTLVKLPGDVHLSESGQLVATFENEPQLPFEDAELHFFGGEQAPLATPARCGTYTTSASFVPWSTTLPGGTSSSKTATSAGDEAAVTKHAESKFDITTGPGGGACPGAQLPFSPSLSAGGSEVSAGAFNALTTTIGRQDGEQNMQSVQLRLPPGLSGLLSKVKLCGEPQANAGTCGPESLIGETTVAAGVGSDPVNVKGGKVFITEKYDGAPFGLSIVNPVKAGPFDLEHDTSNPNQDPACDCVVVRARIEVNPTTAALTVSTDESGEHAIPHIIDGIPVQIKDVNVLINRAGFTFNPSSCDPMSITGTIGGYEGASSGTSVPFKVHDCASLKFAPKITFSTSGGTTKKDGADLITKVTYPSAPQGTYADVARVKVELPKALPSRLTTLQRACTSKQFELNPAACPPESKIGYATVHTPLLPVPLTGPAIFVSHGGEAFPSLTMVLQGYGVTIDLVGTTFISKKGITSTTFKTVPDQPFSTFELTLPQGKFSALAANVPAKDHGSLCGQKLVIPNEFVGQNGAVLRQDSTVAVTGCPLTRAEKLKAVLKTCRRQDKRNKTKRENSERTARKKYGPLKKRKKKG